MPPNTDYVPPSSLGIVPPASRSKGYKLTVDVWLEDKQDTDGAEGFWRVFDDLYDLTDFIDKHPGGSEWLTLTKGTDITEAFTVHHLSTLPEEIMKKYFVKKAKAKRNVPFSFEKDGFYMTLKDEIRKALPTIPKQSYNTSIFIMDALVFFLFLFSTLATYYWSYGLGVLAGIFLGFVTIAAHNFLHQKDNFRMYYFQFSFMQVREYRISHVLNHHLLTNTIYDLEISFFEPILQYLPIDKTPLQRYGQLLLAPFIWITVFHSSPLKRIQDAVKTGGKNLKIPDLSTFLLPLFMYLFGGQSFLATMTMWNFVVLIGSLHYGFVSLHAGHHHPDVFHDGDTPRDLKNYDWGLSQLDAVMERKEINGSHFLVLTNFGDHCLHHLFPTIDHGYLEHLYSVFEDVLKRFDSNLRMVSQWDTITGGFQQLVRVDPNPNPPGLKIE